MDRQTDLPLITLCPILAFKFIASIFSYYMKIQIFFIYIYIYQLYKCVCVCVFITNHFVLANQSGAHS